MAVHTQVLITGAGAGIGLELARLCLSQNDFVVALCRKDVSDIWALQAAYPHTLAVYFTDLSNLSQTHQVILEILHSHPEISTLVNNAGVYSELRHETPEKIERTVAVNVLAPLLLSLAFLRHRGTHGGQILNISSVGERYAPDLWQDLQSQRSYSGNPVYNFSKLWLTALTFWLARANPHFLINCVHPGAAATSLIKKDDVKRMPFFLRWVFRMVSVLRRSPRASAQSILRVLASVTQTKITGGFFMGTKLSQPSLKSQDPALQQRAFEKASELLKQIEK